MRSRAAAAAPRPDHARIFELDERFHRGYMKAAGPSVRALHDTVKPQAERYERLYVSMLTSELHTSVVEHRAIVKAIRAGNARGRAGRGGNQLAQCGRALAGRGGGSAASGKRRGSW